ncbi:MAG TPA: ATP-binding protein [Candidatus Limnocylindrales bacterium]|nr:ATP-binding protein [Candidatus Limnocylindrales bacterium]
MLPPEPRLPLARPVIKRGMYFVVHAPRQTGKTTTLLALAQNLTAEGRFAALYFSCETAEPAGDDYVAAQGLLLQSIREWEHRLPRELRPPATWPAAEPGARLGVALGAWARACPRPLVLFFDEIDALRGDSLLSVLRQLRAGYTQRPHHFPASVGLCGLRDVRDYKVASGGSPELRLGTSSPFNINVQSFRMGDFSEEDLWALYAQHTAETGQAFTEEALTRAWEYTAGQPWLVNALVSEVIDIDRMDVPPTEPITAEHIDLAKERLILARATHLDSLVARLHQPRVRRILEPLIAGDVQEPETTFDDDLAYVRDLGLIAQDRPIRVANPIYREVILRVLGSATEESITAEPRSFVLPDGRLDFDRLLREFTEFWKAHGEILTSGDSYHEVAPQLVIMAFFHRLVNGGGFIDREYGVGRGRVDLLIRWPYQDSEGQRVTQRQAVELKVWRKGRPDPLAEGLAQLDDYLSRLHLDEGVLVIFDRRPDAEPIDQRVCFDTAETPSGRRVTFLRA